MFEALESLDESMSGSFDTSSSNSFVLSQEDTFSTPGPERDAFARSNQPSFCTLSAMQRFC
jgi:hypothetical protein